MAEAVLAPEKVLDDSGEALYQPEQDFSDIGPATPKPVEPAAQETPAEGDPAKPTEPAPEPKPVAPAETKHSIEAIQQAAKLGIPAEDVEDMSPKELQRTITHLNRHGQYVWDVANRKPVEEEKPKTPAKTSALDNYDLDGNPEQYRPEIIESMRTARELRAEREATKAELKALKEEAQSARIEVLNQRIDGLVASVGETAAAALDRTTVKGQAAFKELLIRMGAEQNTAKALGRDLTEKQLLTNSLRAMGIESGAKKAAEKKEDEIDVGLAKRAAEFDAGALAKPVSRGGPKSALDSVEEILKKQKKDAPKEERTVWEK